MRKLILVAVPIAAIVMLLGSRSAAGAQGTFQGHMFAQRYDQAAEMLVAPSALEVAPDGSLAITDRAGNSTAVPAAQLPLGDGDAAPEEDGGGPPQRTTPSMWASPPSKDR